MPEIDVEDDNDEHQIVVETIEDEYYVHLGHDMRKTHYISFFAYVTSDSIAMIKMYPEQLAKCGFRKMGHGSIYAYCNRHGLYKVDV